MDSFTISNSLSKGSVYESESIYNAYREDAQSRLAGDERPVAISNEQIQKGDVILETYRVEGEAIHGGMGSVWRVHHNSWNTDLAMKRPQPRFFAEGSERRKEEFIAECEHWINLGLHPNIVSCYYVREIGGVPTIFSEWMDGGSLKDAIQSGRLYEGTADEVQARILDVAIQAARGLAYSHEKGLIHQDVKPGNILLTKGWDAKVADFGLAKARSQLNDSDRPLSSGYTLQYCPREQAEGARAEAWMDVYAWAATVLEMLLRHRPWQTGAEAKDCVPEHLPGDVGVLIMRCLSGKQRDFAGVEEALVEACGSYDRPEPKAAAETSDSLNNRALSYLDLGKPDEAEKLWRQALRTDATGFYARYNYELWRWAHGRISDVAFHDAIFRLEVQCKAAALARARISLCRRVDLGEAERCLEALELRWSVDDEVEDGLLRSLSSWKRALQAMPALPADCFSEASRQAEAMFLSKGFAEAFPRLTARQGAPFRILETGTGRILREMNVQTAFNTGDEAEEWLEGYMPEGGALLHAQYMFRRCIALPDPEIEFPYELAMVQDHRQRRMAEEQAIRDYDAARAAWAAGRVVESARILDRCLNRGTLMLHEPSMALWTELGRYFSKKALIAAAPTDMPASPPQSVADPSKVCQRDGDVFNQGWACVSCDGVTELRLTCSRLVARENLNNNTDAEFTYCVTATDVATGKTVFQIDPFFQCEEDDDLRPFSRYQIRMDMPGKLTLWSQYEAPRQYDILDMPGATVRIALPGGYDLVNCSDGVEIGGVLHADRFTDYRPLFNAEIIPCRDHNYRLIYEYDLSRENTDHSGMDTVSLSNTLSKGSVIESDSIYVGDVDDVPGSLSNEQIRKGDVILETYRVEDDAINGGMGSVWRVHHNSWNADLAMKRPQPRFFAEGSERRKEEFIAECEHWINLGLHPNIVSCYYVREIGGVPTIFSEWMDGGSLKDVIESGRLYEGMEEEVQTRILDIAIQTARGLQYAHEQGLIHQDVKPGNILLTKDWEAKAADFGLAKAQSQLNDGERPLSTGYTLQYCPKEQAEGATAEAWMDVYAWALTVLEMYAGKRLWDTGAEAQKRCEKLFQACRMPLAQAMQELLSNCLTARIPDFSAVEAVLTDIYRELCGHAYPHPEADAIVETADVLSNQGISYLEIGLSERGISCVEQANATDPHHAEAMFNHALIDWRKGIRTGDEVYLQLLKHHPFFTRMEAGRQALHSLLREAGKPAFDAPLVEGLPDHELALAPVDRAPSHFRLWQRRVYWVRSVADADPWRGSLLVLDAQTGAQLSCEEIAPIHDCQDQKVLQFALNADCSQLMLYLSDGTLLLYDLASHSIAAQHNLPMLKYGESVFHLYTVGTGGRFFRYTVSHLPRHNDGPFSNISHMTFVPPTEAIYDLKTEEHLERPYSDWDLIRADADGTLPAYSESYRFSLSDERQAIGIREDDTGRRQYCSEDGSATMPVPPVLDALLYRLWRNEHDGRDCRVLRITGDGRIWIRNGPKLTEFDLITGKSLHSFPLSGMDNVSIDEDGLGVLLLRGNSWYFRSLEPIRPEDRAAWLFSAPENYEQYLERKRRIEDIRAAFDRAEAQGSTADMCAAYDEAEGCRGFFGTAAQRDMADRLRRSCRQKDSELFLDVQRVVSPVDGEGKSLLAPFGEWRDIPDGLIRHRRKEWVSNVIVSPDARRALILSGNNGGPSADKGGLYLADLLTDKLYLLKEYDRRVGASCGFCADRTHIVYDTNEIRGARLQYADISDGSQQARDVGEWEAAGERNQRCRMKDHFIGACFSKKPLPGMGDGVSMIWAYGIFTFQTEADFDAFYARPGKRMQILAADEPNGLIAYQAVSKDERQMETTKLRVWSVDERRDLLQISDWDQRRGIVRFAQSDGGALRMLAARLGLSNQDSKVYPIEIYQLRCAYAPEATHRRCCGHPQEWPVITLPECDWEDDRFGVGFQGETVLRDRGMRLVNARSAESLKGSYFIFCDLIRRFPESGFMEVYQRKLAIAVSGLEKTVIESKKASDAKDLEDWLDQFQARLRVYSHEEETIRLRDKTAEALADVLSGRDDTQSIERALALYAELTEGHPDETIYRKRLASVQKQLDRRQKGTNAKISTASLPAQTQSNDSSVPAGPEAQSKGMLGKFKGLFSRKKG